MQKPSFWRLVGAYVIDFIMLLCLNFLWIILWQILASITRGLPNCLITFSLLGWIFMDIAYFAFLESKGRRTLGKRICKLSIQPANIPSWKTFVSYGLDCGLFVLIGICIYFYMKHNLISHLSAEELAYPKIGIVVSMYLLFDVYWISVVSLLSAPLYFSILEHFFGKTLGKKLMGLQVVQVAPQTAPTAAPIKQKEETK